MATHEIFVKSLQCNDCFKSIEAILVKTKGVTEVALFKDEYKVCITGESVTRVEIMASLASLGYFENEVSGAFSKKNTFDFWYCHCCDGCE
ncbi:MAG: hypothetical protein ABIS01_09520 [Ferruginibacter sp.]